MEYLNVKICHVYLNEKDEVDNFSVIIKDNEGYAEITLWFDKDGNIIG